MMFASVV